MGRALSRAATGAERIIDEMLRDGPAGDGRLPRPSSSNCCSGCAISRRRRRRPGRRCSGRSKSRETPPTRCCGSNTSAKRRSARHRQYHHEHAAAVGDRLDAVLRARQRGRADPARRSRGRVRARWTSRRAIATGIRSSSWRSGAKAGAGSRPARHRARPRRQAATTRSDRRHHVGYYLISRGRFRLERDSAIAPPLRERLARFVFTASRRSVTRARSPSRSALSVASFADVRRPAWRLTAASCGWSRWLSSFRSASS